MNTAWKKVKLKDIGSIITGNTPPRKNPEFYGNHTLFIKPTDIQEDVRYTKNPEECYSELGFKKYKNSLIPKGSTCVVTIGSIGKKMTQAHCDCFVNQAVNAVVPSKDYDENFVYYLLKYNLNQVKGLDSGTASGRENVSKTAFSNIEVSVPNALETQTQIANILSAYDDLIENNLRRIKLLEEMAELTYREWFVNLKIDGKTLEIDKNTGLPFGWEYKPAENIFNIKIGKTPPREEEEWFQKLPESIKWSSIKDINNSSVFILETNENITSVGVQRFNMNIAPKNTLILSFKLTVGKIAITTEQMVTNEAIAHFNIIDNATMTVEYIYCYLKCFNYDSLGSTSSIGTAINSKIVKSMPILQPTKEFIDEFDNIVKPIFKEILNLSHQNRLLKESRDILLPRLMSGEVGV